jgi:5-methylcytosine-specific restriction endonuclease McrA
VKPTSEFGVRVRTLRTGLRKEYFRGYCLACDTAVVMARSADKRYTQYKRWAIKNHGTYAEFRRAMRATRRQQETAQPGDLSRSKQKVLRAQATHCFYCAKELTARNRTIDHVIPLSRGGRHDTSNVVVACRSCNISKQDAMLSEWRARQ